MNVCQWGDGLELANVCPVLEGFLTARVLSLDPLECLVPPRNTQFLLVLRIPAGQLARR